MSHDPNSPDPRLSSPGQVLFPFFALILILALTAVGLSHYAANRGNTLAHPAQTHAAAPIAQAAAPAG